MSNQYSIIFYQLFHPYFSRLLLQSFCTFPLDSFIFIPARCFSFLLILAFTKSSIFYYVFVLDIILHQQILMKINFEEIFSNLQLRQPAQKKASHISQASTSLGFQQLIKSRFNKQRSPQSKHDTKPGLRLRKKNPNEIKRVLQTYRSEQPQYYWFKQSKLDEQFQQSGIMRKQKKMAPKELTVKEVNNLTNRLSQGQKCLKKECLKTCSYEVQRRMKQQVLPLNAPRKRHRRNLTQICEFEKKHPSDLHERLYLEYKTKQFRSKELAYQYDEIMWKNNKSQKYQNEEYTKNYVPFYERLEQQIQKRNNKQQFFDKNVIDEGQILSFHPDISISMKTLEATTRKLKIIPKKQKNQLKGRGEMKQLERLSLSLNNSFDSVMNRSVQLVQNKEEKMINKLVDLFNDEGYFTAKPEAIEQMDEQQFSIFWPLISTIEKNQKIQINQFEDRLRAYLKKMPRVQKLALRRNGLEKDKKERILIRQEVQRGKQQEKGSKTQKKAAKMKTDYLNKIKNYI